MAGDLIDEERLRREVIGDAVVRRADAIGYLTRKELANFVLPDGSQVRLIDGGGGGIWNPAAFAATLSVVTSPTGPYADREEGGLLHYSYQKGPEGGKNLKLRAAKELGLPLLRLRKIAEGIYLPIFPVFVIDDNPITREFVLTLDRELRPLPSAKSLSPIEKAYAERLVRQRVHQPAFRARVMLAYERTCAVCNLKHPELLDAAHIIEDGSEGGDPVVTNGLSLCKIHHAAYDRQLLGITPDYEVRINQRLLDETDGPMLRHGLQEMHGRELTVPRSLSERPDPERLDRRFILFTAS